MDFKFTKEQEDLRQKVRNFAEKEVKPNISELEKLEFPSWLWKKEVDAGFMKRTIPKEYGGDGAPFIDMVIMLEELTRVDFQAGAILQIGPNFSIEFINKLGSEELKRKYLPSVARGESFIVQGLTEPEAGSALSDLTSSAILEDNYYLVNALKHFITFGWCSTGMITFVRFPPQSNGPKGIGAIIVDKDTPGYTIVRRLPSLPSTSGGNESIIKLENCRVPKENLLVMGEENNTTGFKKLLLGYNTQRVGNAAQCVGLAQNALELAIDHSKNRKQFGRPICEFQTIQGMIVDMVTKIECARLLTYKAAVSAEEAYLRLPPGREAAIAKLVANEMVFEVTDRALQIFGGYGYEDNSRIGKLFLKARGESIGGGTVEMQKNLLASEIMGRKFSQRKE
jgi:alkylation response protein AidB-like acyl-CoA dehydrogenase